MLGISMVRAIEAYRKGKCSALKPLDGAHWLTIDNEGKFVIRDTGKLASFEVTALNRPWVLWP